jgi:hypothetical protein
MNWVKCARFVTEIGTRELFRVIDAALRGVTGHWAAGLAAGVLLHRASVHRWLSELDATVAAAQDSLAAHRPGVPGYTRATHRFELGDILCEMGCRDQARPVVRGGPRRPRGQQLRPCGGPRWAGAVRRHWRGRQPR